MFGWMAGKGYVDDYGYINLGIEDQKAAIEWVSREIYQFGGSKTK
jgi:carboxylesterase type B